jgi:hypothetical protein
MSVTDDLNFGVWSFGDFGAAKTAVFQPHQRIYEQIYYTYSSHCLYVVLSFWWMKILLPFFMSAIFIF